ncbi:MAG: hypothetical protein HY056_00415 [Proteobacteria bacterium]|nr:hypothetical protein [Pseudomonadota bacterium]
MTRLHESVRGLHHTPPPVGLLIPFAEARKAVKEFVETDGDLPKSIAWVANRDLPANAFPDPGARRRQPRRRGNVYGSTLPILLACATIQSL